MECLLYDLVILIIAANCGELVKIGWRCGEGF